VTVKNRFKVDIDLSSRVGKTSSSYTLIVKSYLKEVKYSSKIVKIVC